MTAIVTVDWEMLRTSRGPGSKKFVVVARPKYFEIYLFGADFVERSYVKRSGREKDSVFANTFLKDAMFVTDVSFDDSSDSYAALSKAIQSLDDITRTLRGKI